MAVAVPTRATKGTDQIVATWRDRIVRAKEARRPFEKTWLSSMAFAAGQHWLVWDELAGQQRHISTVDPRYRNRVLYTADRINEYLQAQYGELNNDNDRPELITVQDGDSAEEIARELNLAVAHGWDNEWKAADALARARLFCLVMGHSAVRMRFNASKGQVTDHQPVGQDGQLITDPMALQMLEQHGVLPDGSLPRFETVHEGRSIMEAYTAFQLLTPPGVIHEDDFPWEVIVRPVPVEDLHDEYGAAAEGLVEDTDIASAAGLSTGQGVSGTGVTPQGGSARLREHCWLYTGFRRPCRQYPDGQTVVLASNDHRLLNVEEKLPYKNADGDPSSGIAYFHWWRLTDRFQSRALIEPLKDPQRLINERETQNAEIIARGMPKAFVKEGDLPQTPTGVPLEIIEMKSDASPPQFHQGIGPGAWMYEDLAHHADNLAHASTLSALRLGENPQNVDTYSQLFLLNENESRKRDPILSDHRRQRDKLVEFGVHDIREWWPETKMILVSGPEGELSRQEFKKSKMPDFYVVKQASGVSAPRSQAAEIKKVDAIWQAALASQVVAHDPDGWMRWYATSLSAGEMLELPEPQKESQEQFAAFENYLMENGEEVQPADYDLLPVHLPVHREAQDQARAAGDMELYQRLQRHIDASQAVVAANAAQLAAVTPPPAEAMQPEQQPPPQGP